MEQECVGRRRWLSREHFLDLLAATNLVPGPNAAEMAIHIGFTRAGWPGLIAGGAFIVPAFLISLTLSVAYVRFGSLPQASALFYGVNPAVMAIILAATYHLGRTALRDKPAVALGAASLAAALLGVNEVVILLGAGAIGVMLYVPVRGAWSAMPLVVVLGGHSLTATFSQTAGWLDERLVRLTLFFLKVGALLFGSGMV